MLTHHIMRIIVKGGWLRANTLKSVIKSTYDRSEVEGWDKIMDTPEVSAYKHPSGQVAVALRGTEGTISANKPPCECPISVISSGLYCFSNCGTRFFARLYHGFN